jgi:hypothetical protein
MKQTCSKLLVITLLLCFASCEDAAKDGFEIFSESYNFDGSKYDWIAGFSDFPAADSSAYELNSGYTEEPSTGQKSLMISGKNLSDDLFMFYKTPLKGFKPNTEYILTFEVEFSTDAKTGLTSTGEDVYLKVGATGFEPKSVIDGGYVVMNIDKGNHETGGQDMIMIGNIAASGTSTSGYTLVQRSNTENYNVPCVVRTSSNGELWLIMGTDSGYGGTTTLYYTKVSVIFSASN